MRSPHRLPEGALLPSQFQRNVRLVATAPGGREHALSSPQPPTESQSCTRIGPPSTRGKATGCSPARASCSNHESPRRGLEFVTRKIARAAARISRGFEQTVALGNLDARRDWGFAGDYVEAMWRMLQQPEPADYVIGTGETRSVGEFAELAFARVGLDYRDCVVHSTALERPAEVPVLQANPARAMRLGWWPKASFAEVVAMMVDAELAQIPSKVVARAERDDVPVKADRGIAAACPSHQAADARTRKCNSKEQKSVN